MMPPVTISEHEGVRYLHLGSPWVQGAMRLDDPDRLELEYIRQMMMWTLFLEQPRRIAQLGLGAGALTRFCHQRFPQALVEAVELNPDVLRACRLLFELPPDNERLHVHVCDALDYLEKQDASLDILQVDLYSDQAEHPALEDQAFYQACQRALTPQGLLTVNLLGSPLVHARNLHALQNSFAAVAWMPETHDGNIVAIAFNEAPQIDFDELYERADRIQAQWDLFDARRWVDGLYAWMEQD
ncbi:spermine/spermidine synthase domain-containing protein [Alcaligenes sp. SDU_A2]|uniref:spermine/spermidine synthase domain-containing protein n=1 Tax=Alcaligenes sp. SDU_A2 TaxID=3136634 RepID=UPI00311D3B48